MVPRCGHGRGDGQARKQGQGRGHRSSACAACEGDAENNFEAGREFDEFEEQEAPDDKMEEEPEEQASSSPAELASTARTLKSGRLPAWACFGMASEFDEDHA